MIALPEFVKFEKTEFMSAPPYGDHPLIQEGRWNG